MLSIKSRFHLVTSEFNLKTFTPKTTLPRNKFL